MSYSRLIGMIGGIVAILTLSGCGTDLRQTQIGPYPIRFAGEYEKDYTVTDSQAAIQLDDEDKIGTMIQSTHQGIRDESMRNTYLQSVTYPSYSLSKGKRMTSDCEIEYIRYHGSLVSDPVSEQKLYLSYVFITIPNSDQTITISYLTPQKSARSSRDDAREETLGCTSDT